jgi:two-component system, chemotaxis family, chemotaxis protein CheY
MSQFTILVVDDSASMRKIAISALSQGAYRILEASHGRDGLDIVSKEAIDLILTDVNMPVMDGLEFIQTLRKLPEYAQIPVIIITTQQGERFEKKAKEAGANASIIKPYDRQVLLKTVEELLGI